MPKHSPKCHALGIYNITFSHTCWRINRNSGLCEKLEHLPTWFLGANYSDLTVTSTKVHLDTRSDPKNLLFTPFYVGMFSHLAAALITHTITITEMIEDTTLYTLMVPLLYVDKSKFATARENLVRKKTEALVERLAPKAAAINVMMKRLANPMNKDRIMLACNETTVLKAEDSCRTMHVLRLAAPRLYKIQDQMRGSSAPHRDLTGNMVSKGNQPQMVLFQVREIC